jgi:hypothetical protein
MFSGFGSPWITPRREKERGLEEFSRDDLEERERNSDEIATMKDGIEIEAEKLQDNEKRVISAEICSRIETPRSACCRRRLLERDVFIAKVSVVWRTWKTCPNCPWPISPKAHFVDLRSSR